MLIPFLIGLAVGASAQTPAKVWNFDSDKPGALSEGFAAEKGQWRVVSNPTAPSKPNVIAQLARSSGSTFNLALVKDSNFKDLDISVMMMAISGKNDQGGGPVWRAKDSKNYYVARYNPLEDNYRVYKIVNGRRSQLQSAEVKHQTGWHLLRVTMQGDRIQCYYDQKKYLDVQDRTFQEAGKIGLWTKSDAETEFDDLTVRGG